LEIPYNPNVMEQRNGRIDRHGRREKEVLIWHPVDGGGAGNATVGGHGDDILRALRKLESMRADMGSVNPVTFAAYKVPEVADALADAARRGVRVVFVLESDSANGGKVDIDPLPHLAGEAADDVEAYEWPVLERARDPRGRHGTLHAKFAVADRNRLLVSSANLTEFAFNLNIELGVMLTGGTAPAEAAGHVDRMIRLGVFRRL
jgi:hypothetical protein